MRKKTSTKISEAKSTSDNEPPKVNKRGEHPDNSHAAELKPHEDSNLLPPGDFSEKPLQLVDAPQGNGWYRVYQDCFPDPLGSGPGRNRFSGPKGDEYNLVYIGENLEVAFVETILRDKADGRSDEVILSEREITSRKVATITPDEPLRLVDLTGTGGVRLGVPSDVVGARDQRLAQKWSEAFYSHPDKPDGILYPSRIIENRCIALYDRAVCKVSTKSICDLVDAKGLKEILDDLCIGIVDDSSFEEE